MSTAPKRQAGERSCIAPRPERRAVPLTHSAYLAAAGEAARRAWVQIRKYHPDGPAALCGQVRELSEGDGQWFKVETCIGVLWGESKNLRLCSGDGLCTCEAEAASARPTMTAAPC